MAAPHPQHPTGVSRPGPAEPLPAVPERLAAPGAAAPGFCPSPGAGAFRQEVGAQRGGGREQLPACQGLPVFYVLVQHETGDGGGINPEGEASGVPREHRGGLIGEDLWVWEEKAEAGLGKGKDKRKRGRAARRGRTPPGSAAAAVPSRVLPAAVRPPCPSHSLPPASLARRARGCRAGQGSPGLGSSPPQAEAGAAPRGRRRRPADCPGSGRAPGEERLRGISWPALTPEERGRDAEREGESAASQLYRRPQI